MQRRRRNTKKKRTMRLIEFSVLIVLKRTLNPSIYTVQDEEEDSDTEEYEGETQYPHMPVSIAWSGGPVVVDAGTEATPIVIDSSSEEEGGGEVEEEGEEEQREGGFRMQLSEVNVCTNVQFLL